MDFLDEIPVDPYMSYLNFPHLHFHGIFTANVATINNDVKNFDVISLCHMMPWKGNPSNSPDATGSFLLKTKFWGQHDKSLIPFGSQ